MTRGAQLLWFAAGLFALGLLFAAYTYAPDAEAVGGAVASLRDLGPLGAVAFIAVYAICAAMMLPATPFPLTAGFLWGPWVGFGLAWAGELSGALLSFALGRTLLRGWAERLAARYPLIGAFDEAVGEGGFQLLVLVRLSPVLPFGVVNYGLGLTAVPLARFAASTALGVVPASVALVFAGASLTKLSAALRGEVSVGPVETGLTIVGLFATVLVTAVVSRATRRALDRRLVD